MRFACLVAAALVAAVPTFGLAPAASEDLSSLVPPFHVEGP